jgi:N-methylhydantoinase A
MASSMTWRVGVDIGGTFIDFCVLNETTHELHSLKVLTTPDAPGREVMQGMELLRERYGVQARDVAALVHGTTVGINTIIQRKGARLALLTTAGFEDVIELARLRMPDMYSLFCARPDQLVPRNRIFGVGGRILSDGSEKAPLDEVAVRKAVAVAQGRGAEGIIIAFINAYRNPVHEQVAKAIVQGAAPELFVFTSTEVWPVIREYERSTTAILNGYVHPRVAHYLTSLERALREHGVAAPPMVTKSNGGIMNVALGKTQCVNMLLSGTASGVMGAAFLARQAGVGKALTLDIGGTSADMALVIDGQPQFGTGEIVGDFPLYVPSVSVSSIGEGGGSIATVDRFGVLRVGPASAGSDPGPACYGRGGERATITDAMVVCGFLGHAPLAYRSVTIDRARAEAVLGSLASAAGRSVHETAWAIVQVAISGMFVEVNKLIARYGVDPRDFTLLPFGGAGPMLGCLLAREMGIEGVMVPLRPGVVSALGGLIADVKNDFIRTVFLEMSDVTLPALRDAQAELIGRAEHWLRREQNYSGQATHAVSADMSYRGQSFEIEVPLEAAWIERADVSAILAAFHRRHAVIYEFADEDAAVQILNLRLVIAGVAPMPSFPVLAEAEGPPAPERFVSIWYDGAGHSVPLFRRDSLRYRHELPSPAVVVQDDATICIPAGFAGRVDAHGNLHLRREA